MKKGGRKEGNEVNEGCKLPTRIEEGDRWRRRNRGNREIDCQTSVETRATQTAASRSAKESQMWKSARIGRRARGRERERFGRDEGAKPSELFSTRQRGSEAAKAAAENRTGKGATETDLSPIDFDRQLTGEPLVSLSLFVAEV